MQEKGGERVSELREREMLAWVGDCTEGERKGVEVGGGMGRGSGMQRRERGGREREEREI